MFVLTHKAAIYDHVKQFYTVAEPYRPVVSNLPPFSAAIMSTIKDIYDTAFVYTIVFHRYCV